MRLQLFIFEVVIAPTSILQTMDVNGTLDLLLNGPERLSAQAFPII